MAERTPQYNDQTIIRAIRKAIERFRNAEDDESRMRAIMAVAALGAVSLVSNKQMMVSTATYIESSLR